MIWHKLSDRKPRQGGKYLVAAKNISKMGMAGDVNPFISEFNLKTRTFSFDDTMQARSEPARIYAWCEIPPYPVSKEKDND